jgi:O-antigen/teichoic acid export membrane protein
METGNIAGGTLRITLANASQYLIVAVFYMIVTKTNALTQADIGTLSILTFLSSTFSLLTMLSLNKALTKFTSEKLGKNQHEEAIATQKTVTKIVVLLSIVGFVATIFLSKTISQFLWNNAEYTILLILNFTYAFFHNLIYLCDSTLQALYLFGKMATITFVFIFTSQVTAIVLALLQMGVTGVIIGYIVGSIAALTLSIIFLRGKLKRTTRKNTPIKPLLSFSFPIFLTSITTLILEWADIVIITSLINDLSLTGIYHITVNSVGVLSLLYVPVTITIFPAISSHSGLGKTEDISNILKITSRYLIYLMLPSCIGLAIVAPTAITFFYGSSYAKGAIPLAILSFTTIITALFLLFETAFQAIGKTGQILKINIIIAASLVILLLPLVPLFETTGAAFARLITKAVAISLAVYLLKKEIKIHLDKETLWKSTVSAMAIVPFLLSIELFLSTKLSTVQTLALEIPTAAGIYILSLYALKALKSEDFQLLKQAFPKPLTKYINIIERLIVR